MKLTSPSFGNNGSIPEKHTCNGSNTSPPLVISGIPEGTMSLAIICDDPDAPSGTFVHFLAWNIPPSPELPEGGKSGISGRNDFGKTGYGGPCPPPGSFHHYHFRIYALDSKLDLPSGATRAELEDAMKTHILAEAELVGKFKR